MFKSFDPKALPTAQLHEYMLNTIAPRPIAWASTVDNEGHINLAPFSFFNFFSSNPPIIIFSPNRRVRDNTSKHTLENVLETKEVVINIVNYDLAGQMVLTSAEFSEHENEFDHAGLTMEPSVRVKPPRVKESPAQFECTVRDVIKLGDEGGSGNLIICEVVHLHLREDIFMENGKVDPRKVDNIARLGYVWYTRASAGLFELPTPRVKTGKGILDLPHYIRDNRYFTQTELSKLASFNVEPTEEELEMVRQSPGIQEIRAHYTNDAEFDSKIWSLTKDLLGENKIDEAWKLMKAFAPKPGPTGPMQG